MKKYLTFVCGLGFSISARALPCEREAIRTAYSIYKNRDSECYGQGTIKNCSILNGNVRSGTFAYKVVCSYSGEPDYSDYLEVDLFLKPQACNVLRSEIIQCYTD